MNETKKIQLPSFSVTVAQVKKYLYLASQILYAIAEAIPDEKN